MAAAGLAAPDVVVAGDVDVVDFSEVEEVVDGDFSEVDDESVEDLSAEGRESVR